MSDCEFNTARLSYGAGVTINSATPPSLILQLFEMRQLLLEKKQVKFTSQGLCMYPFLKRGDTLTIEFKSAKQIEIGDIAVYRRQNKLFGHRVIAKGNKDGLDYIVSRPDTAGYGNDGPNFDKDILGVVTRIERNGKAVSPKKTELGLAKAFLVELYLNLYINWCCSKGIAWHKGIIAFVALQQHPFYRLISKCLLAVKKPLTYSIGVSWKPDGEGRFWRKVSLQEFADYNSNRENTVITRCMFTVFVERKIVGSATFRHESAMPLCQRWWVSEVNMRIRYRARGVEEALFKKVDEFFRQSGVTVVWASVAKGAHLESLFFKNLGFKEDATIQSAFCRLMKRPIGGEAIR